MRITGGIEQMGAGLVDGGAQPELVHAQYNSAAFAPAPADDDGIDIAVLSRVYHGTDSVVDRVQVEAAGTYQPGQLACLARGYRCAAPVPRLRRRRSWRPPTTGRHWLASPHGDDHGGVGYTPSPVVCRAPRAFP